MPDAFHHPIGFVIRLDSGLYTGVGYAEIRKGAGDGMEDQVADLRALGERATALRVELAEVIDGIADPMLPGLRVADELVGEAERLRALLLIHARRRGQSWNTISRATGTPRTTWRDRLARSSIPERTT